MLTAKIKAAPEDFVVSEIYGFAPTGSGEHLLIEVEKRGMTTTEVAKRLCHWAKVPTLAIGYAGMKDRQALARQRFSVHLPRRAAPDLDGLADASLRVVSANWHARKLPRGALAGNAFTLTLREVEGDADCIAARLCQIAADGVPNRFGMQRFGRRGDNVEQARRMFEGARAGRERRSMLLSAARSELFNRVLDARVRAGNWNAAIDGEVFMLDGSRSVFGPEPSSDGLRQRIAAFDIHPSGPLWGRGGLRTASAARALEMAIAATEPQLCAALEASGMMQERRALRLRPANLSWNWPDERTLVLHFSLPPGAYATAVLAEICGETSGLSPDGGAAADNDHGA